MTHDELKTRLLSCGADPNDLELVIQDVQKMIAAKVFIRFVPDLTPEIQQKFQGQTSDQVITYLKEHPTEFPKISNEEIQKVEEETWKSYFAAMGQT